jgi:hypothetical protein
MWVKFTEVHKDVANLEEDAEVQFNAQSPRTLPVLERGHLFNGTDQALEVSNSFKFIFHHSFTIETWVRFKSVSTSVLFSKNLTGHDGSQNAENLFMFYIDSEK